MIKLLISDDEKLICEGLASLEWDKYGIQVAGTARNGEDAFNLAMKIRPDIIISDIQMPKKDGIWLAEQLHNNLPDTKIIFLSGYNEFEYAQSAIRFGVSDYVLKPIDEDELFSIILKLKTEIEDREFLREEKERLAGLLEKSRFFLCNWFFSSDKKSRADLELFGISPNLTQFIVSIIHFNGENNMDNVMRFLAFDKIRFLLEQNLIANVPFFDNEALTFVFCFKNDLAPTQAEALIFSYAEKIKTLLDENFTESYNIGIGNFAANDSELKLSYDSANTALSYSSNVGENQIIYIKDIEPHSVVSSKYTQIFSLYITALKSGDEKKVNNNIKMLFESMHEANEPLSIQQRYCLSLIVSVSNALSDLGCNPAILFNNTDAWSVIRKTRSSEELLTFISNISSAVMLHIQDVQQKRNVDIIEKVKAIVDENYAADASLRSVAAQVFMSPCYLSVIFKKEMNITFKNYLIQKRIEKAKYFLANTNMKIYEIAERVGYADTRYFSELFHRTTKETPSQYRSNMGKME
jgi:two-component system response regulator YesN